MPSALPRIPKFRVTTGWVVVTEDDGGAPTHFDGLLRERTAKLLAAAGDLAEVVEGLVPLLHWIEGYHERTDALPDDFARRLPELIQRCGAALDKAGLVPQVEEGR